MKDKYERRERGDYNRARKRVLDSMFDGIPGVKPGKMFGFPAYYTKGRLFARSSLNLY